MKVYNVCVVGATGAVGQEMMKILEERNFPLNELRLFASSRSKGKALEFKGETLTTFELNKDSFEDIDIALFSAGAGVSREFAPKAAKAGAVVIDNSSAFRMDKDTPLVVPEINPESLSYHKGIIANPNCSTIQMVLVLHPLHEKGRIKRVVVTTYQSVSGTGLKAMVELRKQSEAVLNKEEVVCDVYPYQIAFNLIPQIGDFLPNGYTQEEMKMVRETQKILADDSISITATCVRVPVFISHSESVNIELERKINPKEAREILSKKEGVAVVDDPSKLLYPTPLDGAHKDLVYVGRIREDISTENGLSLWVVSDNLRKGAALNAVQIAEKLVDKGLV
ncbi:MAG: aspartate-semialdehyde dehydrogenase [bacterium]|nr:aspartate-semialdehyde dehydrogenase [bacterium]